jgi:hypothetical protein
MVPLLGFPTLFTLIETVFEVKEKEGKCLLMCQLFVVCEMALEHGER